MREILYKKTAARHFHEGHVQRPFIPYSRCTCPADTVSSTPPPDLTFQQGRQVGLTPQHSTALEKKQSEGSWPGAVVDGWPGKAFLQQGPEQRSRT